MMDKLELAHEYIACSLFIISVLAACVRLLFQTYKNRCLIHSPGHNILIITEFLFSRKTYERVFVPMVDDMRMEYYSALSVYSKTAKQQNLKVVLKVWVIYIRWSFSFLEAFSSSFFFPVLENVIASWKIYVLFLSLIGGSIVVINKSGVMLDVSDNVSEKDKYEISLPPSPTYKIYPQPQQPQPQQPQPQQPQPQQPQPQQPQPQIIFVDATIGNKINDVFVNRLSSLSGNHGFAYDVENVFGEEHVYEPSDKDRKIKMFVSEDDSLIYVSEKMDNDRHLYTDKVVYRIDENGLFAKIKESYRRGGKILLLISDIAGDNELKNFINDSQDRALIVTNDETPFKVGWYEARKSYYPVYQGEDVGSLVPKKMVHSGYGNRGVELVLDGEDIQTASWVKYGLGDARVVVAGMSFDVMALNGMVKDIVGEKNIDPGNLKDLVGQEVRPTTRSRVDLENGSVYREQVVSGCIHDGKEICSNVTVQSSSIIASYPNENSYDATLSDGKLWERDEWLRSNSEGDKEEEENRYGNEESEDLLIYKDMIQSGNLMMISILTFVATMAFLFVLLLAKSLIEGHVRNTDYARTVVATFPAPHR